MILLCRSGRNLAAFSTFLLLIVFGSSAFAQRTIHVPEDAPSVQQAIDQASDGDTVSIEPGTYHENIEFRGKAITVKGAVAANATILDGSAQAAVVTFNTGEGRSSVLSNLTLQDGAPATIPEGGGISINGASPTIINNTIRNNFGCGIGSFNGAPLIQGNLITGTTWGDMQGCEGTQGISSALPAQGSGVLLSGYSEDGQQAQVIGNTIQNNTGHFSPGGVYLTDAGTPLIQNNIINKNQSDYNSAILALGDVAPAIVQNLLYDNLTDASHLINPAVGDTAAVVLAPTNGAFRNSPSIVASNTIAFNRDTNLPYPAQPGTQMLLSGYYDHVQVTNNVIVADGPRSAISCDQQVTPPVSAPKFDHNDVYIDRKSVV